METIKFNELLKSWMEYPSKEKRDQIISAILEIGNLDQIQHLLELSFDDKERERILAALLKLGTFDQLANLYAKNSADRPTIFEVLLIKGTREELLRFLETIYDPDQRERIIKVTTTAKILGPVGMPSRDRATSKHIIVERTPDFTWDAFICHASEDKDKFVRQLATELKSNGLNIWYDEFTLKIGDKLRQRIEHGLVHSRYGIVVLSHHFFEKDWPQDELDGLDSKERNSQKVILPVWLDVDHEFVATYSPMLSGRLAARASDGMKKVISDLVSVIKPSH